MPGGVSLDPFQRITEVGWGGVDLIAISVGGRTEISVEGAAPPPPKDLAMRVAIRDWKNFDPCSLPIIQELVPGLLPPYPAVPPTVNDLFDAQYLAKHIVIGSEPLIMIDSMVSQAGTDSWIVIVDPLVDPYVILPEIIPNPFTSEAEADSWIAGFRGRWPGWEGVPFFVIFNEAGSARAMTTNVRSGSILINAKNLRRALTVDPKFPPKIVTIEFSSVPNQGGYGVSTHRGPANAWDLGEYMKADKQLSVGHFYDDFENQVFVSPNVVMVVDFATLAIDGTLLPPSTP